MTTLFGSKNNSRYYKRETWVFLGISIIHAAGDWRSRYLNLFFKLSLLVVASLRYCITWGCSAPVACAPARGRGRGVPGAWRVRRSGECAHVPRRRPARSQQAQTHPHFSRKKDLLLHNYVHTEYQQNRLRNPMHEILAYFIHIIHSTHEKKFTL